MSSIVAYALAVEGKLQPVMFLINSTGRNENIW